MSRPGAVVRAALVFTVASGLAGCTSRAGMVVPNAHYVYPNSNVELLGAVSATKSKTSFFVAPGIKMDELEALYREALAQKNGDILVNAIFETQVTLYPFLLTKAKYEISGTAAKMTVGKQKLADRLQEDLRTLKRQADTALDAQPMNR